MQIKYATGQLHYPVWGMSPSSSADDTRTTAASASRARPFPYYGTGADASHPNEGLSQCHGCAAKDVVTTHASFLALDVAPQQAYANIQALRTLYPGVYGTDGRARRRAGWQRRAGCAGTGRGSGSGLRASPGPCRGSRRPGSRTRAGQRRRRAGRGRARRDRDGRLAAGAGRVTALAHRDRCRHLRAGGLAAELAGAAQTSVAVALDGRLRLVLGVADALRPDSRHGVARLRALGLETVLATGGTPEAATAAARAAGIGTVHAGLLPQDKSALAAQLRSERGPVAMVGDGMNDAPALAAADIGIAVATGTGAAMAAADITLVHHGGIGAVADAVLLARGTRKIIRQNLGWAFGYNLILVPLAATGVLPPVLAAVAMATSSVTVVGNALRLRRFGKTGGQASPHRGAATPRPLEPATEGTST